MTTNPWARPTFTGPAYGGPLAGVDITHDEERKDIYVLNALVGHYVFLDDQWLWSPIDAS